jgi:hypothetical protein
MHLKNPFDTLLDEMTEVRLEDAPSLAAGAPSIDPATLELRVACLEQIVGRLARLERIVQMLLLALVEQKNEQ